jgi:hypothetical protein
MKINEGGELKKKIILTGNESAEDVAESIHELNRSISRSN